jgi:hypothetical protein
MMKNYHGSNEITTSGHTETKFGEAKTVISLVVF